MGPVYTQVTAPLEAHLSLCVNALSPHRVLSAPASPACIFTSQSSSKDEPPQGTWVNLTMPPGLRGGRKWEGVFGGKNVQMTQMVRGCLRGCSWLEQWHSPHVVNCPDPRKFKLPCGTQWWQGHMPDDALHLSWGGTV